MEDMKGGQELHTSYESWLRLQDLLGVSLLVQQGVQLQAGVHQIFFVWYQTFFPKDLSYETRDCYYQKMRQKSRYEIEYITQDIRLTILYNTQDIWFTSLDQVSY